MPKFREPVILYKPANESFRYYEKPKQKGKSRGKGRLLPIFESCEGEKVKTYCISHDFMAENKKESEIHLSMNTAHIVVIYCLIHERFEEA